MITRPFNAAKDIIKLLEAALSLGYAEFNYGTSGTITWSYFVFPAFVASGKAYQLKMIFGSDSDADNGESVVFPDEFTTALTGIVPVPVNNPGSAPSFTNETATGFDYVLGGSNLAVAWVAFGVDEVTL